ncbi:MAG TPA: Uma2 family endonuclease [Blastocatellia bacterium]|nr:Uma2 family endonuclease [Blastocatellia bacterium]
MTAVPKKKYTLEEYLELDKNSEERYEYFDGEVFAMAGGSPSHARISLNVCTALTQRLKGARCEAFNSEMRIKVPAALPYRYPDASVVCGEPIFDEIDGQQMLVNPTLIVEVLSPSTAAYDLVDKFFDYQSIDTFQEYLIISQDRPHVIQHVKQSKRRWLRIEIEGIESELKLESVNVTLVLCELYERVDFQTSKTNLKV